MNYKDRASVRYNENPTTQYYTVVVAGKVIRDFNLNHDKAIAYADGWNDARNKIETA